MTEDELEEDSRRRWWFRIRRAYDVPDIVGNDAAYVKIGQELELARTAAELVGDLVKAVALGGARGELDSLIVRDPLNIDDDKALFERSTALLAEVELAQSEKVPSREAVEKIIRRVRKHIDEWPLESADGATYWRLERPGDTPAV